MFNGRKVLDVHSRVFAPTGALARHMIDGLLDDGFDVASSLSRFVVSKKLAT